MYVAKVITLSSIMTCSDYSVFSDSTTCSVAFHQNSLTTLLNVIISGPGITGVFLSLNRVSGTLCLLQQTHLTCTV